LWNIWSLVAVAQVDRIKQVQVVVVVIELVQPRMQYPQILLAQWAAVAQVARVVETALRVHHQFSTQ
jgi:hypothetical protein